MNLKVKLPKNAYKDLETAIYKALKDEGIGKAEDIEMIEEEFDIWIGYKVRFCITIEAEKE